jgi:hypothetical protein
MKARSTPFQALAEYAAQLACVLALGLGVVGLAAWWHVTRLPASDTTSFLNSLTNPPSPTMRPIDLSAQEAALAAGTQPVRVVLSGAHDLFAPSRPAYVARGDGQ